MHACMHACMHVCMYVCMYVCRQVASASEMRGYNVDMSTATRLLNCSTNACGTFKSTHLSRGLYPLLPYFRV